jgi:integrase
MATFKAIIGRLRADGTYAVRIRVTHQRQLAYIPTDIYVDQKYVRNSKKSGLTIHDYRVLDKIDALIRRYMRICNESDLRGLDVKGVVALINANDRDDIMATDFVAYVKREAEKMKLAGHAGTATNRITAINALCRVLGCDVIPLSSLTRKRVRDAFCSISGNRAPSLYKAQLQAAYNSLMKEYNIDADVIPFNPFTGIDVKRHDPPKKRALDMDKIMSIFEMKDEPLKEGTKGARYNLAKDVFMLSFFLVGMNSADLFSCSQYKDGRIIYERQKTRNRRSDRALMSVKVPDIAMSLFEKYRDKKGSGHVFRFWRMYADKGTFNAAINKGLDVVGKRIGEPELTFYAARHSWATIAVNDCGIDKWTVHLALNHVDPATAITDIYIKKSWKPVDEANGKVIEKVFG